MRWGSLLFLLYLVMRKSYILLLLLLLAAPAGTLHAQSTLTERSQSVVLVKNMEDLIPLTLGPTERISLLSDDVRASEPLERRLGYYLEADRLTVRSMAKLPSLSADELLIVAIHHGDRPLPEGVDLLLSKQRSVLLFMDRPSDDHYTDAGSLCGCRSRGR